MEDLMQKLATAKKLMEIQERIPRGQTQGIPNDIEAMYNVPNEVIQENTYVSTPTQQRNQNNITVTPDRIKNSKLPDEIKRLMMEHPIEQPSIGSPVLSNDIIEGAARLMGRSKETTPQVVPQGQPKRQNVSENSDLKQMIRDVVRDTVRDVIREELSNAGLLTESSTKTNEILSLRVGSHIFEGKVLKIKKIK